MATFRGRWLDVSKSVIFGGKTAAKIFTTLGNAVGFVYAGVGVHRSRFLPPSPSALYDRLDNRLLCYASGYAACVYL